ncbi:MAG: DUF4296 domain-containing protein [Parafilimonas sp.]|nr:DUF4296 domain-containing protein [Parafilimonas sp.]
MSKYALFLLIFCFITSCTPEDKKIPKDILPIDSMKLIVWDLTRAGAYASALSEKDTTKKSIGAVYLAEVLNLHKISKPDFFKSFDFYQTHPLLNQQLFDSVNAYAQRQRNEMYKKMR